MVMCKPQDIWYDLGKTFLNSPEKGKVLEAYEQAITAVCNSMKYILTPLTPLIKGGTVSHQLAKCCKIQPDDAQVWYERGLTLARLELYEEAIASFAQSIKIKPDYYQAWYSRGLILALLELYEEAIATFDQVIKIKPDYYRAWYFRGWALIQLGHYQEATASLDKVIDIRG